MFPKINIIIITKHNNKILFFLLDKKILKTNLNYIYFCRVECCLCILQIIIARTGYRNSLTLQSRTG